MKTQTVTAPELRFADDGTGTFTGYAARFNEVNDFNEVIEPGAFKRSLRERKANGGVALLWSHDPGEPIGTLTDLREDQHGLRVSGQLVTETRRGAEALALMKAGAVSGLSIGFRSRGDRRGPKGVRVLTDVDLVEVSVVSLPAASGARITKVRQAGKAGTAAFIHAARRAALSIRERVHAPNGNTSARPSRH